MTWGSPVEVERRNRIRLSVWAYAYEVLDDPIATDDDFDKLALAIRPDMPTGHRLDFFFATEFAPGTGMWVRKHPEPKGLLAAYQRVKGYRSTED